MHCTSFHCDLSINQVSFQSLLYFPRYGSDRNHLWTNKCLRGDNYVNIQGMIMGLVHCPWAPAKFWKTEHNIKQHDNLDRLIENKLTLFYLYQKG